MSDRVCVDDLKSAITKQLANRALTAADAARDDDRVFKLRHFAFKFDIKLELSRILNKAANIKNKFLQDSKFDSSILKFRVLSTRNCRFAMRFENLSYDFVKFKRKF